MFLLRLFRSIGVVRVSALVFFAILAAGGPAATAFAQSSSEPAALQNVKVWVNPEYDDALGLGVPSLLVMMEGQIAGAQPPVRIRFLVPTPAQMYSAGSKNAFGEYKGGPPDRKASAVEGWDEISFQLTETTFRVEYYVPIGQSPQKSITYAFSGPYSVQGLSVFVQQPKGSDNFTVTPPGTPTVDSEGFSIRSFTFANVEPSVPVSFDISYYKASSQPSLTNPPVSSPGGTRSNLGLFIALAVVAAALGGGGVYLFTRSSRQSGGSSRSARRRARTAVRSQRGAQPRPVFCSQCGTRLDRPGKFCPKCGADSVAQLPGLVRSTCPKSQMHEGQALPNQEPENPDSLTFWTGTQESSLTQIAGAG